MDANTLTVATPPAWSLTVGDAGRISVLVAVSLFGIAVIAWLFAKSDARIEKIGKFAFAAGCLCTVATFLSLATLFLNNRFEFEYIWAHSDLRTAPIYKLAAVWSGQQGSFLLWAVSAAIFGWLAVGRTGEYRRWFSIAYSGFLGAIVAILAYESPFKLILVDGAAVVPADGRGLAPSLQNYWVTIHPPVIFLGFGSLTVLFALALAALINKNHDTWIGIVRPWAILSTTLVGVGLCMGGFWAYETLGWGGFWMWDPVENVSFVPWCLCAAFIHGVIVQVVKNKWKIANLLMAGLPFLTFVYGTFLTRSGFLADASVHSFAEMDRSALRLLMFVMGISSVAFLGLWSLRAIQSRKVVEQVVEVKGVHREGMYRLGALALGAMGLATMIGMSVPFFMALQGRPPKVVEEATYHKVLPWIFVPLVILMAIAPFVAWNGATLKDVLKRAYSLLCIAIGACGFILLLVVFSPLGKLADLTGTSSFPFGLKVSNLAWVVFLAGLSVLILVGTTWRMYELRKASKLAWSSFITHGGVAMLMAGLIVSRGFERKIQTFVMDGHPGTLLDYAIRYKGMTSNFADRENKMQFEVISANGSKPVDFIATPGFYYIESGDGHKDPMAWPHVQRSAFYDLYFTMHEPQRDATEPFTLKPGESREFSGYTMTYKKMVREGDSGMAGTKFGAELHVKSAVGAFVTTPKMELGSGGTNQHTGKLGQSFEVQMTGMDAATKAVTLQVQLAKPMYPLEIYVKPLTSLVWLGTAVMTLGGFMSAYYRRVARKVAVRIKRTETGELEVLKGPLIPI
jgi:cytochrome c-type biogenesis protein CcmF